MTKYRALAIDIYEFDTSKVNFAESFVIDDIVQIFSLMKTKLNSTPGMIVMMMTIMYSIR